MPVTGAVGAANRGHVLDASASAWASDASDRGGAGRVGRRPMASVPTACAAVRLPRRRCRRCLARRRDEAGKPKSTTRSANPHRRCGTRPGRSTPPWSQPDASALTAVLTKTVRGRVRGDRGRASSMVGAGGPRLDRSRCSPGRRRHRGRPAVASTPPERRQRGGGAKTRPEGASPPARAVVARALVVVVPDGRLGVVVVPDGEPVCPLTVRVGVGSGMKVAVYIRRSPW